MKLEDKNVEIEELQKTVNPIYTTAKGTALTLARAGDGDVIALLPYIGADELTKGSVNAPPAEILIHTDNIGR